jgi:Mce-associated membrane protein
MSATDTDLKDLPSADDREHSDTDEGRSAPAEAKRSPKTSMTSARQVSFSLHTMLVTVVTLLLAGVIGLLGWLYWGARHELDVQARDASNKKHAEEVAAGYAVNAADMDYQDFNAWKAKLVKGTSAELNDKLTKAADSMEQILAPLQWISTAKPLATKVRSNAGGIYIVDSFVSVLTKTMQAPDGLQSTATYSITIDSSNNWQITDVGGIDSALKK